MSKVSVARYQAIVGRVLQEIHTMDTPCWIWTGADSGNGYGRVSIGGKMRSVHIVVYEVLNGSVPEGHFLDHECRNRLCCNPDHLTPRTPLDNTLRGEGPTARNAAKTHCKRGHALEGANLISRKRNGRWTRECLSCKLIRSVYWRHRRIAALAEVDPCPACEGSGAWDKVAVQRGNRATECCCKTCIGTGAHPRREDEAWSVLLIRAVARRQRRQRRKNA